MKKILCALLIACLFQIPASATESAARLSVVATNFPSYDFVRAIAGELVDDRMLLLPGAESHSYEPTPRDIIAIQNCDVFVHVGGENEAWVDAILDSMDASGMKIISLLDCAQPVEEEIVEGMQGEDEEEEPEYDEHIWTSPKNAILIAQAIADVLSEADPAHSDTYRDNAQSYIAQLTELDAAFQGVVDGAARKTIVFGDRFPFRYLADAYGLSYFAAFPGCATETEPSAQTVAFLIDKVKAEQIPVVFHIEMGNEKMTDAICEATGAKKGLLHACHNISKDDFEAGLTYLDLMRRNVDALREALN